MRALHVPRQLQAVRYTRNPPLHEILGLTYFTSGADSRDMSIFKDDDGTAYLLYASDNNQNFKVRLFAEHSHAEIESPSRSPA
jgi:hypothetical protein